jgi:hypothetical protein
VLPAVLDCSLVNGDTDAVRVSAAALARALKMSVVPHKVTDIGVRLVQSHDIHAGAHGHAAHRSPLAEEAVPAIARRSPRRPSRRPSGRASVSAWNARPTHRPADDAIHWRTTTLATMSPERSPTESTSATLQALPRRLPAALREVIVLAFCGELTQTEIAAELDERSAL